MKVTAKVQRSGEWWAVEVPEVPGVFTQSRRLDQVADQVADAVATMLENVRSSEVEVEVEPVLDEARLITLREARDAARAAAEAQSRASAAMRAAVTELRERLSIRDVAALLGVSHQRVSQLEQNVISLEGRRATRSSRERASERPAVQKWAVKKTTAKKTSAKKTSAKKSAAKKSAAATKRSAAKKVPAKRTRNVAAAARSRRTD